jgi:hypothetical protein
MAAGRSAAMIIAVTAACCPLVLAGAGQAAAGARVPAGAAAAAPGGTWHAAVQVPGTAAVGNVDAASVSCGSAGSCTAGGSFLASEVNGRWRTAIEVPGPLNKSGTAMVNSVSCASAGNCAAGGYYYVGLTYQAFVDSEVNGRWRTAIEVPGPPNKSGTAMVNSVSCGSAGNCAAGGIYGGDVGLQAFVVSEVNGRWGTAIEVPGTAALNKGGWAQVSSVSCAPAGNCGAGGQYISGIDASGGGNFQAFVASEVHGRWRSAIEVPGTAGLNKGGWAQVSSVSCSSAGNCGAGGYYRGSSWDQQAFVASEVNGRWRSAIEVPGTGGLNQGGDAQVSSVSCGPAGNCAVGGFYQDGSGGMQAFVAGEVNGRWRSAIEVPGTGALNQGGDAQVSSVSCGSAGNCAAGGTYADSSFEGQAFVSGEVNGRWRTAIEVPGTAALNRDDENPGNANAGVSSVSCTQAASCTALGGYTDGSGSAQAFVASES